MLRLKWRLIAVIDDTDVRTQPLLMTVDDPVVVDDTVCCC